MVDVESIGFLCLAHISQSKDNCIIPAICTSVESELGGIIDIDQESGEPIHEEFSIYTCVALKASEEEDISEYEVFLTDRVVPLHKNLKLKITPRQT